MHFLRLAVLALSLSLCLIPLQFARAEEAGYPSRPIRVIIPSPVGGATDISFRALAEALERILGQKIAVVNKPGDDGAEGLWEIANAAPDGYTLGATFNGPLTASPHVRKLAYTLDNFTFIATTFEAAYLACTRKDFPAETGPQLVNLLRQKPLAYSYGSDGKGSSGYFAAEGLFDALGIVLRNASFNSSREAARNLMLGNTDIYVGTAFPILPLIRSGTAKCPIALSVEAPAFLPGASVPAGLGAAGKEAALRRLIIAPKGLPEDRAARLEAAVKAAMASPAIQARFAEQGERAAAGGISETTVRLWQEYAANAEIADRLLLTREPVGASLSALNGSGPDVP